MLRFARQGKHSLILLGTGCTAARGLQQHSRRTVSLRTCATSPAPLDFDCLWEQVLSVSGDTWLRSCLAEPIHCLSELSPPNFVAVVRLVALSPPRPCLLCEQLQGSKKTFFLGDASRRTASVCFAQTPETWVRSEHGSTSFFANLAALAPHMQHHAKLPVCTRRCR